MPSYLEPLLRLFRQHADAGSAADMEKYMRHRFVFYGIKSPLRRRLLKVFIDANGLPAEDDLAATVRDLWRLPRRECQYAAVDLLRRGRKPWRPEDAVLAETLITARSWWDTVDALATRVVGGIFQRHPAVSAGHIARWRRSDDPWLRRTVLLFQLHYREKTDTALLFDVIAENAGSGDFFIQKAIGWALRQYARTDPKAVERFVAKTPLAPLSVREALKHIRGPGGR
jgi:3-methyladenine DNA glycosylase AlkD